MSMYRPIVNVSILLILFAFIGFFNQLRAVRIKGGRE